MERSTGTPQPTCLAIAASSGTAGSAPCAARPRKVVPSYTMMSRFVKNNGAILPQGLSFRYTSGPGTGDAVGGSLSGEPVTACTRSARARRSAMGGSLSSCDPHLERLRQDLEHMALALGQLSQPQEAVVRQGYLPRYGPVTAAEQAHVRDGVVRSQERARGDDSGATTGQP